MKRFPATPLLALAAAVVFASPLAARTWTQAATGKTIDAEFVKLDGDEVVVKMADGQERNLPLAMLSAEDKSFADEQAAKMAEPSSAEEAPAAATEPGEVTLLGVHLCCSGCEKRVKQLAEENDEDLKVSVIADEVRIKGGTDRAAQAAVDRIINGGFYGKSNSETVVVYPPEANTAKLDEIEVSGVHLCCGKCVSAVEDALEAVANIEDIDIKKGESNFLITGKKVDAGKVIEALNAAGLNGKARKPRDEEEKE